MNILPKKRWHVRTKENIARVRKDEAEAAEKERQEQLRIDNADREARLNILKHKSKQKLLQSGLTDRAVECKKAPDHINLFENFDHAIKTSNTEHDKETKEKKEEYEKKIGYLTYLGQDTNEALGKKNWYEVAPNIARFSRTTQIKDTYDKLVLKDSDGKPKVIDTDVKDGEIAWKAKQRYDPLKLIIKHSDTKRMETKADSCKNKSVKRDKNCDKIDKLQKLREARLQREQKEKYRTELFLKNLSAPITSVSRESEINKMKPKYNSQFNPELARQNFK